MPKSEKSEIELLRERTNRAKLRNAQEAEAKKRKEEARIESRARSLAADVILQAENEKIPEAADKGNSSALVMWAYSEDYERVAAQKVISHFQKKGYTYHIDVQEPFGSDPQFFHTVYHLYISWG